MKKIKFILLLFFIIQIDNLCYSDESVLPKQLDVGEIYQKKCDSGDAQACNNLAYLFDYGKGNSKDKFKAIELYKKACLGGIAISCSNLGLIYENGEGVPKDNAKSFHFFSIACDLKDELGCVNSAKAKWRLRR